MRRPLTLIAFVFSTVFLALDLILEILSVPALVELFSHIEDRRYLPIIAITVLLLGLVVANLVLNSICISKWCKSIEKYASEKGFIIATIIMNFTFLFVNFLLIFVSGQAMSLMQVVLLIVLTITCSFALIDMAREKERIRAYKNK